MRRYQDIYDIAAERKGGTDALESLLTKPKTRADLLATPEDRWLATMTKAIFQSGFNWKVIENKWSGFEEAFAGFDVGKCAFMDDDWLDQLIADKRIVRNGQKIVTVRENATMLLRLRDQGGASAFFANSSATDFIGLLDFIGQNGSRLGGMTGMYAMRFMGVDSFALSRDVTARLIAEGVIDKPATSKSAMRSVQAAFNTWMDQSGRSLTEISRTLAFSL